MSYQTDLFAETILEAAFPSEKQGRGFYCHLDHAPGWRSVAPGEALHTQVLHALNLGFHSAMPEEQRYGFLEYGDGGSFYPILLTVVTNDEGHVVGGFYDGDGDVVVSDGKRWARNTDMKCHYDWHEIDAPPLDIPAEDLSHHPYPMPKQPSFQR
jgi:hypothetical protein